MHKKEIWVFFYGSFMNSVVLKKYNIIPVKKEIGILHGYKLTINKLTNVSRSDENCVYGINYLISYSEIDRLYTSLNSQQKYSPVPVLIETLDGLWRPALCYVTSNIISEYPDSKYIDSIIEVAVKENFPTWYVNQIKKFKKND